LPQKSLYFDDFTRSELNDIASSALIVVPLGATEQHGPHLPTGTDYRIAQHLALEAARILSADFPVLVAPVLPFGSSDHHLPFGGTLSLSSEVYYRVLCDLLKSLATCGFRQVFLLNGHGGNHELMQVAARDIALKHPMHIGAASYWTLAPVAPEVPGHAGLFETSMMLAIRQMYVSKDRPSRADWIAPPHTPYRDEQHGSWQSIDGYTDSPAAASVEAGNKYLESMLDSVVQALRSFRASGSL
jgi:creatinine amidohydrolase